MQHLEKNSKAGFERRYDRRGFGAVLSINPASDEHVQEQKQQPGRQNRVRAKKGGKSWRFDLDHFGGVREKWRGRCLY